MRMLSRQSKKIWEERARLAAEMRSSGMRQKEWCEERSIKPFVIGRKNWLFSATPKGAETSSVIYSIIETAKLNKLKPFEYLKYIFETIPNISPDRYSSLPPWSETLPDYCKLDPMHKE